MQNAEKLDKMKLIFATMKCLKPCHSMLIQTGVIVEKNLVIRFFKFLWEKGKCFYRTISTLCQFVTPSAVGRSLM